MARPPRFKLRPPGRGWGELDSDFWLTADPAPGVTYPVTVRLGEAQGGRFVVTGLLIGVDETREISARDLRDLRLADLVREIAEESARAARGEPSPHGDAFQLLLAGLGLTANPYEQPRARPGPGGWSPAHYEHVAAVYRQALQEAPEAPVKRTAELMRTPEGKPTPEPTIRRWLQQCRQKGLLPRERPGRPARAGESAKRPVVKTKRRKE